MTRIVGIDPGSRITGFGVIDSDNTVTTYVASGCIRVEGDTLAQRLKVIFTNITELLEQYQPHEVAVEQMFMHRNPDSAFKLGQARGVALCAASMRELPVSEYTPTQIKQSIVGKGHADKEQIQHMVRALLTLPGTPQADAADALAVALCHVHLQQGIGQIPGVKAWKGSRLV